MCSLLCGSSVAKNLDSFWRLAGLGSHTTNSAADGLAFAVFKKRFWAISIPIWPKPMNPRRATDIEEQCVCFRSVS